MSEFQPCSKRDRLTRVDKEGKRHELFRCTEHNADHYFEEVTPPICDACPLRQEVTKAAVAKRKYQPPKVEKVQTRKPDREPEDNLWAACMDREIVEIPSCCGATQKIKVCNSVDCFRLGSQVNPEHCRECIHRRPK